METLANASNRGSVSTGYEIGNSCKFESDGNEYIDRPVGGSDGSSTQHTISCWIKRTELGIDSEPVSAAGIGRFRFESDDTFSYQFRSGKEIRTNRVFRDTASWYHIVAVADSSQATASNRMKLYVNGVQETSFSAATYQDQDQTSPAWGKYSTYNFTVGAATNATRNFNGYLAEVYYIDGQVLDPTYFGEFDDDTGIWKPKSFTGTFGSLDTYLNFSNASDLGENSGGTTDLNENSVDSSNQAVDSPTNSFCTLLGKQQASVVGTEPSIKEGGTTMFGGVSGTQNAVGTMGVRGGKWYFESTITNSGGVGTENHNFGVVAADQITALSTGAGNDLGYVSGGWACASNSAPRNNNATASGANATGALAVDKIMGVAIDMDNGKIWWHREGTWTSINSTVGNPANGTAAAFSNLLTATDEHLLPAGGYYINDGNQVRVMNFGGYAQAVFTAVGTYADANGYGSFSYQPPSGFYALCSQNLALYGGTA